MASEVVDAEGFGVAEACDDAEVVEAAVEAVPLVPLVPFVLGGGMGGERLVLEEF